MCFSRSVDILYRRTKPKKQRARDQRRMEEFLQRKSVMMFLPFADIENEHLGACLYTKAPKEVSKVNMVQVQTPVSSAKAQTQTSASTSDSSSQTEPDSTTISTLQQLWKSVNFLRDETTVLHVSCDQIVKEGQQDFSLFKEQTQKLADIAIRQKAENDQLKQQLEQSLGQITTLTTTLATKQQEIDDLKKAMEDSVQSPGCEASIQTDSITEFADPLFMDGFFNCSILRDLPFLNDNFTKHHSPNSVVPIHISFGSKVFTRDINLRHILKHQRKTIAEEISDIYADNGDIESTFIVQFGSRHYRLMDKVPLGTLPPFVFNQTLRVSMVLHNRQNNVFFCGCDWTGGCDDEEDCGEDDYDYNDQYYDGPPDQPFGANFSQEPSCNNFPRLYDYQQQYPPRCGHY